MTVKLRQLLHYARDCLYNEAMPTLIIISKIFFYTLGLGLALSLNFNFVRFCLYFKKKYFPYAENNLNKAGHSLFPAYYLSLDLKDFKHDERWLAYFIVTVPTLAVLIRSVYYDHFYETYGYYVLVWQIIIQAMAYFYAQFVFTRWAKVSERIAHDEKLQRLFSSDLNREEVDEILHSLFPSEKEENLKYNLIEKFQKPTAV